MQPKAALPPRASSQVSALPGAPAADFASSLLGSEWAWPGFQRGRGGTTVSLILRKLHHTLRCIAEVGLTASVSLGPGPQEVLSWKTYFPLMFCKRRTLD